MDGGARALAATESRSRRHGRPAQGAGDVRAPSRLRDRRRTGGVDRSARPTIRRATSRSWRRRSGWDRGDRRTGPSRIAESAARWSPSAIRCTSPRTWTIAVRSSSERHERIKDIFQPGEIRNDRALNDGFRRTAVREGDAQDCRGGGAAPPDVVKSDLDCHGAGAAMVAGCRCPLGSPAVT